MTGRRRMNGRRRGRRQWRGGGLVSTIMNGELLPYAGRQTGAAGAAIRFCLPTLPACVSDCSAARSIRRTPRIVLHACWRCGALDSIGCGGSSPPAIRSKIPAALHRCTNASPPRAQLAPHARIDVTDFEADLGITYTFATINYLIRRCPGVHFVWIMGADNLRSFHRWQRWRDIAGAGADRGRRRLGPSLYSVASTAGQALAWARLPELAARTLPQRVPPAWIYLHGLKSPLSSTALRAARAT